MDPTKVPDVPEVVVADVDDALGVAVDDGAVDGVDVAVDPVDEPVAVLVEVLPVAASVAAL